MKRKAEDEALESPSKRLAADMLEDMSTGSFNALGRVFVASFMTTRIANIPSYSRRRYLSITWQRRREYTASKCRHPDTPDCHHRHLNLLSSKIPLRREDDRLHRTRLCQKIQPSRPPPRAPPLAQQRATLQMYLQRLRQGLRRQETPQWARPVGTYQG